jgi:hypothetical protein
MRRFEWHLAGVLFLHCSDRRRSIRRCVSRMGCRSWVLPRGPVFVELVTGSCAPRLAKTPSPVSFTPKESHPKVALSVPLSVQLCCRCSVWWQIFGEVSAAFGAVPIVAHMNTVVGTHAIIPIVNHVDRANGLKGKRP